MNQLPRRVLPRLKDYDYTSPGAYFVTICTKDRKCLLSRVSVGSDALIAPSVQLTKYGQLAEQHISLIPGIDRYVIMPNHIHLIVRKEAPGRSDLSQDIKSFWQASFYDHILRDENDYLIHCEYIQNNPAKWVEDELYESFE